MRKKFFSPSTTLLTSSMCSPWTSWVRGTSVGSANALRKILKKVLVSADHAVFNSCIGWCCSHIGTSPPWPPCPPCTSGGTATTFPEWKKIILE